MSSFWFMGNIMGANKDSLRQNKLNPLIVPRDPVFPVEDAPQEDSCAD